MGNGGTKSNGPGLSEQLDAFGTVTDFCDFFDSKEEEWKVAQVVTFVKVKRKIQVRFVRKDGYEHVSRWLRLDSSRLAPHGTFTSAAAIRSPSNSDVTGVTPQRADTKGTSALRKRELSDLGRGLGIAAGLAVDDNTQAVDKKISVGDFVDVLGSNHRWEPASIRNLAVREGRAMALIRRERSRSADREEWVPFESNRIAPFGKKVGCKHHPYHKGQLVDVLHKYISSDGFEKSKWRNGEILGLTDYQVNVRFLDFHLDEWIDVSREPGRSRVEHAFSHTAGSPGALAKEKRDVKFRRDLHKLGFKVLTMENDGNCLFRAVALQVLGDMSMHAVVREKCCAHLLEHADHFSNFVDAGGDGFTFEDYVEKMGKSSTWGGHAEICSVEEIWDRPVFVYRSDPTCESGVSEPTALSPISVAAEKVEPIRLSYHGKSHYNALSSAESFPLPHRNSSVLLDARVAAAKIVPTKSATSDDEDTGAEASGTHPGFEKETNAYMEGANKMESSESRKIVVESTIESVTGATAGTTTKTSAETFDSPASAVPSVPIATDPPAEWGWRRKNESKEGDKKQAAANGEGLGEKKASLLNAEW